MFPRYYVTVRLLVASLLFSNLTVGAHADEQTSLAAIRQLGGKVTRARSGLEVEFQLTGRDLRDSDLVHLAELRNLVSLNLKGTRVTSAGLVHLKGLKALQVLHLERTAVDDREMGQLAHLQQLKYLNLYGTKVTDKTLVHLRKLKNLRRLYVWQTGVTAGGATQLTRKLPRLKVVRGVDLAKLVASFPQPEPEREPTRQLMFLPTRLATEAPRSRGGENIEVFFRNRSGVAIKIFWVGYDGKLKQYGELDPGGQRRQNTYENNTWLITDRQDRPLGYFVCGAQRALAVIPLQK
ncbi:MAG: hypothetical protein VX346_29195 [Planctomycetota bacterium]|nr:hypothetical protein [Planctomycetota bacterium]